MENSTQELIHGSYAIDKPDKRDFPFEEYIKDAGQWNINHVFPFETSTVYNQWMLPACSRYWITQLNNGQNINERAAQWLTYIEIDPETEWNKSNHDYFMASALAQLKDEWLIIWYTVINKQGDVVEKIRQSLAMWNYIYTGSNGRWWWYQPPYNLVKRTDKEIYNHIYSIVGDDPTNNRFKAKNSFWPERWDKGYFYIPYEDIPYLMTLYSVVDKDDTGMFQIFKQKMKMKQWLDDMTKMYPDMPDGVKALFNKRQISANLKPIYWLS